MKNHAKASIAQTLLDANVRQKLEALENDPLLHDVTATYSANSDLYPNNKMPFTDKHYNYLLKNPDVDPEQYLSNLRIMLRR